MAGRKYKKDYDLVETRSEKGKYSLEAEYKGKTYGIENPPGDVKRFAVVIIVLLAFMWCLFIAAFTQNGNFGRTLYVIIPYAFNAVPLYLCSDSAVRLLWTKPPYRQRDYDRVTRARGYVIAVWVLTGIAAAGSGITLLAAQKGMFLADALFFVFCAGIAGLGSAVYITHRRLKFTEVLPSERA